MSAELVVVVCAANVCRSPLAELILKRELSGCDEIRVESAGTRVRAPAEICEMVAARGEGEVWRAQVQSHRARMFTEDLLREASLILVADREVRSEVVRSVPEARNRVFTFREAALLAEGFDTEQATHLGGVVARFVMHLDRTRALRGRPTRRRSRCRRRREVDWSSIQDGHGRSARSHTAAADGVEAALADIAAALVSARGA